MITLEKLPVLTAELLEKIIISLFIHSLSQI